MEVTEGGAVDFLSSIVPEQLALEVASVPGIQAAGGAGISFAGAINLWLCNWRLS